MVKVIDIDLERRRISLSLKQANEGFVDTGEEHFDPTLYGMAAEYDSEGNYNYPEGFDSETGEWLDGYDSQRETWEREYAEAHTRFEQHMKQIQESREAEAAAAAEAPAAGASTSSASTSSPAGPSAAPAAGGVEPAGTLATDEALAALREKLAGGKE